MSNCLWGGSQVGQRRRWDQQRTTTPGPQRKLRNSNTTMHRWAPASRATAHGVDCRWNDDNAAATQQPPHAYEQVRATAHRPFFLSCTIFLKFPSWGVHSNQFFASFSHHFLVPFVCFSAKYRKMSWKWPKNGQHEQPYLFKVSVNFSVHDFVTFCLRTKVMCDNTYSNKSWSVVAHGMFNLWEINQMEREMCNYLE